MQDSIQGSAESYQGKKEGEMNYCYTHRYHAHWRDAFGRRHSTTPPTMVNNKRLFAKQSEVRPPRTACPKCSGTDLKSEEAPTHALRVALSDYPYKVSCADCGCMWKDVKAALQPSDSEDK